MKTNTEPTAIEKLKEHRMQLIDFARNAGDYYLVAQLERENEEINEALSEAERKAFEAGMDFQHNSVFGTIPTKGKFEDYQKLNGAKI